MPISGGGMTSGIALAAKYLAPNCRWPLHGLFFFKSFFIIFGNIKPFVHAGWWQLSQPERSCCAAFRAKKDCEYQAVTKKEYHKNKKTSMDSFGKYLDSTREFIINSHKLS